MNNIYLDSEALPLAERGGSGQGHTYTGNSGTGDTTFISREGQGGRILANSTSVSVSAKMSHALIWIKRHSELLQRINSGEVSPQVVKETIGLIIAEPLFKEVFATVEDQIGKRGDIKFHNPQHTWDVFKLAVVIALCEGATARQAYLVGIAAAYHDLGYLKQMQANEPIGAALAHEAMKKVSGRFTEEEISQVCQAILDTAVPRDSQGSILPPSPRAEMSKWLSDADLAGFGGADFLPGSTRLWAEICRSDQILEPENIIKQENGRRYYRGLWRFLQMFSYSTPTGVSLFERNALTNGFIVWAMLNPETAKSVT